MNLDDYTADELKKALEKKEAQEAMSKIPRVKPNPDFSSLIALGEAFIKDIIDRGYSKDIEHWCYEEMLDCLFTKEDQDWISENNGGY